jgi:hypothetical protein
MLQTRGSMRASSSSAATAASPARPAPLLLAARRLHAAAPASAAAATATTTTTATAAGAKPALLLQQLGRHGRRRAPAPAPPLRATGGGGGGGPSSSSGGGGPPVADRALAALPFLLPLLDAFPFGISVFIQFPFLARLFGPLAPLQLLWLSVPFAPFVAFLSVYAGIVNNRSLPRFVRFSAMQAVMLDILLIIPQILLQGLGGGRVGALNGAAAAARFGGGVSDASPLESVGRQLYETTNNTVFFFVVACVLYGVGGAFVGVPARLPLVAEAAESQVGGGDPGGGGGF